MTNKQRTEAYVRSLEDENSALRDLLIRWMQVTENDFTNEIRHKLNRDTRDVLSQES